MGKVRVRDFLEHRGFGGHKRKRMKFHLDELVGNKVEVMFMVSNGGITRAITHIDTVIRRDDIIPRGYYLQGSNIHINMKHSRLEEYANYLGRARLTVEVDGQIEKQLKYMRLLR